MADTVHQRSFDLSQLSLTTTHLAGVHNYRQATIDVNDD